MDDSSLVDLRGCCARLYSGPYGSWGPLSIISPQRTNPMTHSSGSPRLLMLVAAFAAAFLLPASLAQAPQRLLTRHTRDVVTNGRASRIGQLPPDRTLKLAIMLPLRNQSALNTLLSDLHNPQSPSYLRYLSVAEFTEQFGPTQADVDAVVH